MLTHTSISLAVMQTNLDKCLCLDASNFNLQLIGPKPYIICPLNTKVEYAMMGKILR